ncbi:MAG: hypothetical protein FJY54_01700 [Betaproteobacteria bacterium]|nr:hypothetical protein [Betaproteobacteria bacterium]
MRKAKETGRNSDIYARIRKAQMPEADRQNAIRALQQAEAIADAMLWVRNKIVALGTLFLKPSLKH